MTATKQPEHSLFAFSAGPRWIPCPGSMAYPENIAEYDAGELAGEGIAAHALAAACLKSKGKVRAESFIGQIIEGGKRTFEVTEEFADHVQTYVDDVERRALGGYLMVEQRVTLEGVEGFDASNYGTSDAVIAVKNYGVVEDLKFGQGEKVYAWTPAREGALFTMNMFQGDEVIAVEPNYQLMMYALACLADLRLLIDEPAGIQIVINQPRVGILSELWVPIDVLERFALFAAEALYKAKAAKALGVADVERKADKYLNPGKKQCRWCRALARCPAATKKAEEETAAGFDIIADNPPQVPTDAAKIARAMLAVPFVADWCRAVMARANEMVAGGETIIGPDNQPYKFVEGKEGTRKWKDPRKAETLLLAKLPRSQVFVEKLITAPAAAKLLNKKATKETWVETFEPLIGRPPGKPLLVMGSDPRPPYSPAASEDEFDAEEADE